ncbi:MAG: regulatory protein GemA [Pseudomonadota bacterium]
MTAKTDPRRRPLLAKIHLGKKELGWDDATYRAVLARVTGAGSAADLSVPKLSAMVDEMKRLGWKPKKAGGRKLSSKPHVRKIFALWGDMSRRGAVKEPTVKGLKSFVKRMTGVDDPEWLDAAQGQVVIEALKAWSVREVG